MGSGTFYYLRALSVLIAPVPVPGISITLPPAQQPPDQLDAAPRVCNSVTFAGTAPAEEPEALWPTIHGSSRSGLSPHTGPWNLSSSLAWRWHHPQGRFYTVVNGIVMDGSGNIFVAEDEAVHKLSPDGALLWTYCHGRGTMGSAPTLEGGVVYGDTHSGFVFAVNATTGHELWAKQIATDIGWDVHTVAPYGDIILADSTSVFTEAGGKGGGSRLQCLRRSDGSPIWEFTPDAAVWNFYAVFPGDGTFLFQDLEGRAYRVNLGDGKLMWKRGGKSGTWTDGSMSLGPNNAVYSVTSLGPNRPMTPGVLNAYKIDNGELLWSARTPHPPNQFPAVGALGKGLKPSVVVATGTYWPTAVLAFDAETGAQQWKWQGPLTGPFGAAGDEEGYSIRRSLGIPRDKCMPNAWSNPGIDAAGVIYIGHNNGKFFAIQDANHDGHIEEAEVSSFNGGAGFPGSGPAIGPGVVAIASCDSLFVFKA